MAANDEMVVVTDSVGVIFAFNSTGALLWSAPSFIAAEFILTSY